MNAYTAHNTSLSANGSSEPSIGVAGESNLRDFLAVFVESYNEIHKDLDVLTEGLRTLGGMGLSPSFCGARRC